MKSPATLFALKSMKKRKRSPEPDPIPPDGVLNKKSPAPMREQMKPLPLMTRFFARKGAWTLILFLLFVLFLSARNALSLSAAPTGTTLVVNFIEDDKGRFVFGDECDAGGDQCDLRTAITILNSLGADDAPHQIHFNIPGDGPHILMPEADYPTIRVPMIIDGSTQSGASCPTATEPANLKIVLDGSNVVFNSFNSFHKGITVAVTDSDAAADHATVIRGLVIGNYDRDGISLRSDNNRIECSHIGVAADGVTAMPNGGIGIYMQAIFAFSENNIIGGDSSHAQRNVISSSGAYGIQIGVNNTIVNNYIGTTADGLQPLGNNVGVQGSNVHSPVQPTGSTIGGTSPLSANVISGNTGNGISLSEHDIAIGNIIGAGKDRMTAIPNGENGIYVIRNMGVVGGTGPGEGNLIAHNADNGILMPDWTAYVGNSIRGNQIYNNSKLGIDLGEDGWDSNDDLDPDEGPNDRQNYPVLSAANGAGQVVGTLNSVPNQSFNLDFYSSAACDPSGLGEGETYVGSTLVTTDGAGNASFDFFLSSGLTSAHQLTATATNDGGSTSEFSQCLEIDASAPPTPIPTATPKWNPPPTPQPITFINDCGFADINRPVSGGEHQLFLPIVMSDDSAPAGRRTILASQQLADGGTISGPDGVKLGAVAGSLENPINVDIVQTAVSTRTIFSNPTVHGNYYQISADRNIIFCDPNKRFILGLPIPDGVPTDNLAVGLIGSESDEGLILSGEYDSQSGLMLVTLAGLSEKGATVVLVEDSGPSSAPSAQSHVIQTDAVRGPEIAQDDKQFELDCMISKLWTDGEKASYVQQCRDHEAAVEEFLALVYIEMRDLGYKDPPFNFASTQLSVDPPEFELDPTTYRVGGFISSGAPTVCGTDLEEPPGRFASNVSPEGLDGVISIFCFDADNTLSNAEKRAIRYHYFRSLQYGQTRALQDLLGGQAQDWVHKGTAAAAMISVPANMESTNDFDRRPVDTPLHTYIEEKRFHVQAQDFWTHLGITTGQGLGMFVDLFETYGVSNDGTFDWLGGQEEIKALYWKWVKNQTMFDGEVKLNDDDTATKCTFQPHSMTNGEPMPLDIARVDDLLPPLTSVVVKFDNAFDSLVYFYVHNPDWQVVLPLRQDPYLDYKIYVAGRGCEDSKENEEIGRDAQTYSETDDFYIVIANTHISEPRRFQILGD